MPRAAPPRSPAATAPRRRACAADRRRCSPRLSLAEKRSPALRRWPPSRQLAWARLATPRCIRLA
eukprot:4547034-Pleurochrysis_carterae.AAC.4